ncbi:uncharacterized protein LOC143328691 [Chaetodon auriga]|uniref:uncharacterized protein LOC143328691 n=1 Tax=Chaetodon auriga TaxID=39042 RepID=UPI004032B1EB
MDELADPCGSYDNRAENSSTHGQRSHHGSDIVYSTSQSPSSAGSSANSSPRHVGDRGHVSSLSPVIPCLLASSTPKQGKSRSGRERSNTSHRSESHHSRSRQEKSRSGRERSNTSHRSESHHSRSRQEKSRSGRERSNTSHRSESHHSRSRQELPQTSRTPSEPFPMSTAKFQKCVLKKLVALMQEVKRIGGADPIASAYQLNRMDTLEELDATEERIQQNDERQVLITQLSRVGGKNTRDCTTKIMDRLMTNNLMAMLNMKGHGTKRAFKGTKLYQVVIAAVKSWSQKATEHDISHAVADHLKHAPGRSGGGGYKAR